MTAIFICLLVTQKFTSANIVAMIVAMLGVYLCKAFGLTGPAILIGAIAGVPLDHSFLNYKKELLPHGWEVGKISMKQQTVRFKRLAE